MNRRDGRDTRGKDEHLSYLLTAFAFESISEAGRLEVERHLASCAECRAELDDIRATISSVRGAYPEEAPGGSTTFEQRKLERVLAAARSRRRGRIAWIAWPSGAAAGLLLFVIFLASTVQLTKRSSPGSVATGYMRESAVTVEEFAAGGPESGAGLLTDTNLGPAPEPTQAPASAAAKPPDELARNDSKIRGTDARHLRRDELEAGGVYRHRVTADETRGDAEGADAPAAPAIKLPARAGIAQAPPAPAKPVEVAQFEDPIPQRRTGGRAPAGPTDRWGRTVAGTERASPNDFAQVGGGAAGADARRSEPFGSIVVDARTGGQDLGFDDGGEADKQTELKLESAVRSDAPPKDGGVQNWSVEVAELEKLTELESARSRGKAPIKNLVQIPDGERKESEAAGQKAAEASRYYFEAPKADFTVPGEDGVIAAEDVTVLRADDADVAFFVKKPEDKSLEDNVPQTLETTEHVQGLVAAFEWAEAKPRSELRLAPTLAARGSRERLLRAWAHWKALDPGLALDAFEARRLDVPPPSPGGEGLPAEEFLKRYGVHPFVETRIDAQSTFGMDVDTASYTIARGALASGTLPRPDQVRVEEFVNYFPEPAPASKEGVFAVACEGGPSLFGKGLDLLKITIRARDIAPGERKDAVLTLAVDTSGSMHHGGRLALVREALGALVASLEPGDRVAVVGFGDHPYLVLPHTSAREAERILDALESLAPRGDTNFEAGLDLAYRVADEALEPRAVNRIILCSDGVATSGARGPEELLAKIEAYARRGIHLSTLGVGLGKYNDRLLETLADRGNGSYAYADDAAAAADVFRKNLPGALQVLARDAKIQVNFDPEVVTRYRLLGYENRDIADKDFRNDQVDAGEVGPGTTVTVLYEIERASGSSGDLGRIHLRYADTGTGRVEENDYPLPPGVIATSVEASGGRLRFIACVAEMAELLRESYWARDGSFADVLAALIALGPEDRSRPEVRELAMLAARAQSLVVAKLQGK